MRYALIIMIALSALVFEPIAVSNQADARVGRPLTPMSYAGVARRTNRRAYYGAAAAAGGAYYYGHHHCGYPGYPPCY